MRLTSWPGDLDPDAGDPLANGQSRGISHTIFANTNISLANPANVTIPFQRIRGSHSTECTGLGKGKVPIPRTRRPYNPAETLQAILLLLNWQVRLVQEALESLRAGRQPARKRRRIGRRK